MRRLQELIRNFLLIPVRTGGTHFVECLKGLSKSNAKRFDRIFISLNGTPVEVREDLDAINSWLINFDNVEIMFTHSELSAVEHNLFCLNRIRSFGGKLSDIVTNLFHDDVPMRNFGPELVQSGTVCIGDWERLDSNQTFRAWYGTNRPQQWLETFDFHGCFTNGSGMSAQLSVWMDVAKECVKWRTGVRYEFLALTHRSVTLMTKVSPPNLQIRIHPKQAGANISLGQYFRGEVMFILWLLNGKRIRSVRSFLTVIFLAGATIRGVWIRVFKRMHEGSQP